MKLAHVGLGYWGPNLLRNWNNLGVVVAAFDLRTDALKKYAKQYPNVHFENDWTTCLGRKDVSAVSIATPPKSHYPIAKEALESGKHVFVEKPMTLQSDHAEELCEIAEKNNLILMVGHTFLYSPEIRNLREIIHREEFGDILYMYTNRLNLGKIQTEANVIEDLAPHDVSIFNFLSDKKCAAVQTFAQSHILEKSEDVAFINLSYDDGMIAHLHLSWLDPLKIRKTVVVGSNQMAVCNSGEAHIEIYNKGVQLGIRGENSYAEHILSYRYGDVVAPYFDLYEPLAEQCKSFVISVKTGEEPLSSGRFGLEIVKTVEAMQESLKEGGTWIAT